ncbi:hypothetical protein QN277_019162 [Acacia crassicarpa]|uniref:TF-B3 domain-containing protein n=1 Tax=Acacia crassicarpa TaxID=499986 RepID=A0AAE1MUY5_9FABA|nr:hypothetical protein QN277_019162 [Acacia crassicarpa]
MPMGSNDLFHFGHARSLEQAKKSKAGSSASSSAEVRMPELLTLEDFKNKELDPNSTPLEALAFVLEVALQKLKKSKQAVKKRRRRDNSNALPPSLSKEFKERIKEKCGKSWPHQFTHFYEKKLFKSDISKHLSRITMALKGMKSIPFLKKEEVTDLREGRAIEVPVIYKPIDGTLAELTITLKQWDLHKNAKCTKKISTQYVLNGGWYTIATEGEFKVKQTVDVWAFRDPKDKLCMAVTRRE